MHFTSVKLTAQDTMHCPGTAVMLIPTNNHALRIGAIYPTCQRPSTCVVSARVHDECHGDRTMQEIKKWHRHIRTFALAKEGYLTNALESTSSFTSFPRSPTKMRWSSDASPNQTQPQGMITSKPTTIFALFLYCTLRSAIEPVFKNSGLDATDIDDTPDET